MIRIHKPDRAVTSLVASEAKSKTSSPLESRESGDPKPPPTFPYVAKVRLRSTEFEVGLKG